MTFDGMLFFRSEEDEPYTPGMWWHIGKCADRFLLIADADGNLYVEGTEGGPHRRIPPMTEYEIDTTKLAAFIKGGLGSHQAQKMAKIIMQREQNASANMA